MEERGRLAHAIQLDNREQLLISGVLHVESFDDKEIVLETCMGLLVLRGEGLAIKQLNLDEGKLDIQGLLKSFIYAEEGSLQDMKSRSKNILSRMFG